jgi:hypothetical protein
MQRRADINNTYVSHQRQAALAHIPASPRPFQQPRHLLYRYSPFNPNSTCSPAEDLITFLSKPPRLPPYHHRTNCPAQQSLPQLQKPLLFTRALPIGTVTASRESESYHRCAMRVNDKATMRRRLNRGWLCVPRVAIHSYAPS